MKKLRASSFALCLGLTLMLGLRIVPALTMAADAMPIVGNWEGTLDPGAQPKKRILVHITASQDESLSGTIDYPDQNTSGILITAITYKEPTLHFESNSIQGSYDGTMNKDNSEITGTWKQGGAGLNLILKRTPLQSRAVWQMPVDSRGLNTINTKKHSTGCFQYSEED